MVRTPQGEETLLWDRCLFVRFGPGNEATRLGSISSFTARRICAIPVDRGGSMSAVSAALLANAAGVWARRFQGKTHKSQRAPAQASIRDVCGYRAGTFCNSQCRGRRGG